MVIFFPSCVGWKNVRIADRKTGRLTVKGLPFGQVNERQRKERDGEDKRGIQIKVSREKMEGSRCHTYLKGREQEGGMKTRRECKEEKENQRKEERGEIRG